MLFFFVADPIVHQRVSSIGNTNIWEKNLLRLYSKDHLTVLTVLTVDKFYSHEAICVEDALFGGVLV